MRLKSLIFLLLIAMIVASLGCLESKKLPAPNETKIATPEPTPEQKLPAYNETKPLKINDTFETWSRGYWSNLSYKQTYFRVITNYSVWSAFLEEQGYFAWIRGEIGMRLEGELYPGIDTMPKTITSTDFNDYFIIAAMMGREGIRGPEIEIKNISEINSAVNVTVRMYKPSSGEAVVTNPYHIVIVKRELLPKGNATFIFSDTEGKKLGIVEIKPIINLTYVPASVNGNTNFTVRWLVSGGTEGEIDQTAVLWGYKRGGENMSDYYEVSKIQTGKTPQEFIADFYAPAGGTLYTRVLAIVDGVHVYSPEYQILIIQ